MHEEFPKLTPCRKCNFLFWVRKQKEVGSYHIEDYLKNLSKVIPEWKNAKEAAWPTMEDFSRALELDLAQTLTEELFIRTNIWWNYNDRIRHERKEFLKTKEEERKWFDNCKRLMVLLDATDIHERIMKAEVNRNLGDFENCMNILSTLGSDKDWLKEKFKEKCDQNDRWVFKLK